MSNGNGGRGAGCQLALYLGVLGIAAVVVGTYMAFEKMSGEQISLAVTRFQDFVLFVIFGAILIVVARIASGRRSEPPPQSPQPQQQQPTVIVVGGQQLPQQQRPALTDDDYRFWDSGRRWESTGGWEDERPAGRRAGNIVGGWPDAAEAAEAEWRSETFADAWPDLAADLDGDGSDVDTVTQSGQRPRFEFRTDQEIVEDWIEAWCDWQSGRWSPVGELHVSFADYLAEIGHRQIDKPVFGKLLTAIGVPSRPTAAGTEYKLVVDV